MHPVLSPKGHLSFRHSSKFIHLWNKIPKRAANSAGSKHDVLKFWKCQTSLALMLTHALFTITRISLTQILLVSIPHSILWNRKSSKIQQYNTLSRWVDGMIVSSTKPKYYFFHNFLQNSLQKSFQFTVFP